MHQARICESNYDRQDNHAGTRLPGLGSHWAKRFITVQSISAGIASIQQRKILRQSRYENKGLASMLRRGLIVEDGILMGMLIVHGSVPQMLSSLLEKRNSYRQTGQLPAIFVIVIPLYVLECTWIGVDICGFGEAAGPSPSVKTSRGKPITANGHILVSFLFMGRPTRPRSWRGRFNLRIHVFALACIGLRLRIRIRNAGSAGLSDN